MEFNARLGWQLIYKHQCSTWHSPLNHGINCGRRNEQVVSQPFLFWFGFSSPPLDKFSFFFLYFPSFLLFFYLFIFCFCFCFSLLSFSFSLTLFFLHVPLSPLPLTWAVRTHLFVVLPSLPQCLLLWALDFPLNFPFWTRWTVT